MEDIFEELAAVGSDDEGRIEENDQGGSGNREDEAEEVNDARRVVKPKRVIQRPRPKLDPARLLGPRGIFVVKSTFEGVKFKGKGHELDDLNNILSRLQHWAHRLFPKMTFEDCIERIEELGNKKEIQTNMHKIRNNMVDADPGPLTGDNDETDNPTTASPLPVDDMFDQLVAPVAAAPPSSLTDEQRARMMRNRLLAEERRMARRLAKEKELEEQRAIANSSVDVHTSVVISDRVAIEEPIQGTSNQGSAQEDTSLMDSTLEEQRVAVSRSPTAGTVSGNVVMESSDITDQVSNQRPVTPVSFANDQTTALISDSLITKTASDNIEASVKSPITEDVLPADKAYPDKSLDPTEHHNQLVISDRDSMDVDCLSEPAISNTPRVRPENGSIHPPSAPELPAVDDMDIGSIDDWETPFDVEQSPLAVPKS